MTLTVSHYIYLSREQRYAIHEGQKIEVVGISVPVWFDKGNTSEPAKEIFCKYYLTNNPTEKAIIPLDDGYYINLPQRMKILDSVIADESQEAIDIKILTSKNLLDIKDGGSEWLEFKQFNKVQEEGRNFNAIHFVEIKPEELLTDTLN